MYDKLFMCQVYNPVIILKLSFQDIHLLMKAALIFPTTVCIQTNFIRHRDSSKIKLTSIKACLLPLDWFQNIILESANLQNPMTQETTVVSCLQFLRHIVVKDRNQVSGLGLNLITKQGRVAESLETVGISPNNFLHGFKRKNFIINCFLTKFV